MALFAALAAEICPELALAPPVPAEIYRYLGYPREGSPAPPMAEQIAQVVAEAWRCLTSARRLCRLRGLQPDGAFVETG